MTRPPDELTPAERAAFAALPRETPVSDVAEERAVQALRARGLLGAPRRLVRLRWTRRLLQVAAGLMLFLGGLLVGRRLGPPRSPEAESPVAVALQIQRTGSSFVRAMSRVSDDSAMDPRASATAREVARNVLRTGQWLLDRSHQSLADQGKARVVWF
jgi:hypothetical protein